MHAAYDQVLDLNVRDGLVYYRALQQGRGSLDRYVSSLDVPPATVDRWSRDDQLAFWLNAYNAIVLRTVIAHYPIRGRAAEFPANSIRQVPGAFSKAQHRVGGRALTLDDIEKRILPAFKDPRVYLALGRGAVGSGRLRSEAYVGARLESQLTAQTTEFIQRPRHVRIDVLMDKLLVSPIFGWHEPEFSAAYGGETGTNGTFGSRSPIERAILALVLPHTFSAEREFLLRNQFAVEYQPFDWRLNDLTGGRVN
jgi:hypothetical protein